MYNLKQRNEKIRILIKKENWKKLLLVLTALCVGAALLLFSLGCFCSLAGRNSPDPYRCSLTTLCRLGSLCGFCRGLFDRCFNNFLTDKLRCCDNPATDLDFAHFKMGGGRELVAAVVESILDLFQVWGVE